MDVVKRVMIVGGSGAGKSYLALRLSSIGGLPSYHMDQLSWQPGFVHRTTAELDEMTRRIHGQEHWILEGGHYETGVERARRAHLLIWADLKPAVRTTLVMLRSLRHHGKVRPCMAEGCPERFGRHTIDVVRYAWESRHFHRECIEAIVAKAPPQLTILRLRTLGQVRRLIAGCVGARGGPGLVLPARMSVGKR